MKLALAGLLIGTSTLAALGQSPLRTAGTVADRIGDGHAISGAPANRLGRGLAKPPAEAPMPGMGKLSLAAGAG